MRVPWRKPRDRARWLPISVKYDKHTSTSVSRTTSNTHESTRVSVHRPRTTPTVQRPALSTTKVVARTSTRAFPSCAHAAPLARARRTYDVHEPSFGARNYRYVTYPSFACVISSSTRRRRRRRRTTSIRPRVTRPRSRHRLTARARACDSHPRARTRDSRARTCTRV